MQNVQVPTANCSLVIAIVGRAPSVLRCQTPGALFHASAVAGIQFVDNGDVDGLASLNESDARLRYESLETNLQRPVGIGRRIPGLIALVVSSCAVRRIETGTLFAFQREAPQS